VADHPVKVPQDLAARLWIESEEKRLIYGSTRIFAFANLITQWAADQQLKKVNDWIRCLGDDSKTGIRWELEIVQLDRLGRELWQAMRPKPPTLAERALEQYERVEDILLGHDVIPAAIPAGCIRAALNRLAELEAQQ
jgi:hypothetical protein